MCLLCLTIIAWCDSLPNDNYYRYNTTLCLTKTTQIFTMSTQAMPRTLLGINGDQQSSLIGQSRKSSVLIGWNFIQSMHYEVGRVRTTVMPASTASLVPQTECAKGFLVGWPIFLYPVYCWWNWTFLWNQWETYHTHLEAYAI